MKEILVLIAGLLGICGGSAQVKAPPKAPSVCEECIRKNMEFLASDELRGRASGSDDEHTAAEYIAKQLKSFGIEPAGDKAGFLQQATIFQYKASAPPELKVSTANAPPKIFAYGKEFFIHIPSREKFSGPLKKVDCDKPLPDLPAGSVVLLIGSDKDKEWDVASSLSSNDIAVMLPESIHDRERFEQKGRQLPKFPPRLEEQTQLEIGTNINLIELDKGLFDFLIQSPDGTQIELNTPGQIETGHTWNVIGMLHGSDPTLSHAAILLSAHLDHIGVGAPVHGDRIYNGADDDASGVSAVLELARVLGAEKKAKRTVIFALFGSEETGGQGSTFFRQHPAVPLQDISVNLEFEMIGRADSAVKADTLWLTGWARSNLGPALAERGAHLVGDPHSAEDFFTRSDNYVLAKKGVVAQTVSSYGLHKDYHQPSDDLAHIDFDHMDKAIGSLLGPVEWLVNSDFKPQWNAGGQP